MKEAPRPVVYPFEPEIEQAIVVFACSVPRFYSLIGHAVEADRLRAPAARDLMAAAHAIAKKQGCGPTWAALAVQHLASLMARGKVTLDAVNAAKDYLIDAEVAMPSVSPEDLSAQVAPVIQRVRFKEAVQASVSGLKAGGVDAAAVSQMFDKIDRLGKGGSDDAVLLDDIVNDPTFLDEADTDLLLFGIPEVDAALGGMERQALTLLVGGSGAGKSMALGHIAVEAFLAHHHVIYVTLEISPRKFSRRVMRNLTDMTKREMSLDPTLARSRYTAMRATSRGTLAIAEAHPLVTSPKDLKGVIERSQRTNNVEFDTFVIDFADKLRVNPKASQYDDQLAVIDGLRDIAVVADGWTVTASQSDRKSTNRPWLDLDAVADSMNKIRSADIVIGLGRTEEDKETEQLRFSIPKRREGEGAHTRVGPIPWDPDRGRICMVTNRVYPW